MAAAKKAAKKVVKPKSESTESTESTVVRTKMTDEQAEKAFEKHCKDHEIVGAEKAKFAVRYTGRRLAALARWTKEA